MKLVVKQKIKKDSVLFAVSFRGTNQLSKTIQTTSFVDDVVCLTQWGKTSKMLWKRKLANCHLLQSKNALLLSPTTMSLQRKRISWSPPVRKKSFSLWLSRLRMSSACCHLDIIFDLNCFRLWKVTSTKNLLNVPRHLRHFLLRLNQHHHQFVHLLLLNHTSLLFHLLRLNPHHHLSVHLRNLQFT